MKYGSGYGYPRRRKRPSVVVPAVPNVLTASFGSFTQTGNDAGISLGRRLISAAGSFVDTGIAAGLTTARRLTASTGAITFSGKVAGLALAAGGGSTISNQSITYGNLTLASAGGAKAKDSNSNDVDFVSVDSVISGTGTGWSVSGGRLIRTTGTPAASNGAVLGCTTSLGAIQVTIAAPATNTYHFISNTQLTAALAAAETANPTLAYTAKARDGVDINNAGNNIDVYNYTFSGTIVDVNSGASEADYDYDATASFTGGSFHITADTPYSPEISDRFRILGCTGLEISGFRFTNLPTVDSYNRDDGGDQSNSLAAATTMQLSVGRNGSFQPAEPTVIIHGNRFGGHAVNGGNWLRWGHCIQINQALVSVIEDNEFDGYFVAVYQASVKRGVIRRNNMRRQCDDSIRCYGNVASVLTDFTVARHEVTGNVIWDMITSSDWSGSHSDGMQVGTPADNVDYSLFIKKNYVYLPVAPNTYPGETVPRGSQGIYTDDTPIGIELNGVIAENFIVSTLTHAMNLWRGTLVARNNTLLNDGTNAVAPTNPNRNADISVSNAIDHVINDNLCSNIGNYSGTFTQSGNIFLNETLSSGATSLYDNFVGPLFNGPYSVPSWTVDTTTAATLVADLDSIFATKGAAIGKGHLSSAVVSGWILASGTWVDTNTWNDTSNWID